MTNRITLFEVGPRDGLQNEKEIIDTSLKIELIERLVSSGIRRIEATSFVNPKWIPQLADAIDVLNGIRRKDGVVYSALVPNLKGLERAQQTGIKEIAVFMSASESHNKSNINKTIEETYPVLREVAETATAIGIKVRGYVSTAFGCPYEGDVPLSAVARVTEELLHMGVYEVSIGDTIGVGTPGQVKERFTSLIELFGKERLAGHFHDTRGTGLANVYAALEAGIRTFDSSVGGLGGCPYAPGASGNIATEDVLYMLHGMGMETGVKLEEVVEAGAFLEKILNRTLPSRVLQAMKTTCMEGESANE
ncbi:hydroxymethylglutaryl-CoA lyase [Aneurinibacillus aneurinilyticus]|jgi:hydroxymethylglutaryl-CoA lyase|uniref:Hydroxymethylglutaryl-CoA lyase n=2 Tax=Aneurinibacillus aneurinilyticus TaxID=1391 RepID=A0A848CMK8_ANEAE|nr:hydroxymethylglutaryl-CoA lyase [Aneurinibacillus aneurinilyticus]ERI06878.1 putative hydroxymethylglutaryl-CoA lyase [Aneurinibacillus aneurinilyticus ATCC 12856]MCI1692267.1 hydroxymethylglutaryl-CoA lyase [Aneurinibacillus aneurinilyticus]MED0707907.1 hydroxymethylglutaryl-CoA lyase [Aneurinibacillus aneurinilyticus]MED0722320.1 hydroxymethylglutaryl-CoA lyase [Aneurinibacillus aneurinilyticus]MED0734183.1 hydroxymethylglutaryl-CoA lyase [Aneurinibacillus aneurinilyticus]